METTETVKREWTPGIELPKVPEDRYTFDRPARFLYHYYDVDSGEVIASVAGDAYTSTAIPGHGCAETKYFAGDNHLQKAKAYVGQMWERKDRMDKLGRVPVGEIYQPTVLAAAEDSAG